MNNDLTRFLSELDVYPGADQIDEASNKAQEAVAKYAEEHDSILSVTVEEGEVYAKYSEDISDELAENFDLDLQATFDEVFSEEIEKLQNSNK